MKTILKNANDFELQTTAAGTPIYLPKAENNKIILCTSSAISVGDGKKIYLDTGIGGETMEQEIARLWATSFPKLAS